MEASTPPSPTSCSGAAWQPGSEHWPAGAPSNQACRRACAAPTVPTSLLPGCRCQRGWDAHGDGLGLLKEVLEGCVNTAGIEVLEAAGGLPAACQAFSRCLEQVTCASAAAQLAPWPFARAVCRRLTPQGACTPCPHPSRAAGGHSGAAAEDWPGAVGKPGGHSRGAAVPRQPCLPGGQARHGGAAAAR